ncbi:MAG: SPOR domain-containing protein [Proteobacteria bacterium]|nr:SPOR domain-containing protein [Pseudomonadota bacterium]NOG61710.1 SPOR domain-containing protein [Pseudomonadota bacterium]
MKWFFILLLLLNFIYLGWEIDRDSSLKRANVSSAIKVPAGTQKLVLLSELEKLPETRSHIKLDNELSMENFNSEPVLPIELNPNTEKMMGSLLTETIISKLDENLKQDDEPLDIALPEFIVDEVPNTITEKTVCYTYGPIPNQTESELLSKWLDERGIIYQERQTDEQGKQLFWVYLAPRDSREQAEAAMSDLKQKGVKDLRLIREGDLLNAISLGLFSSQASVNRRLNEIKAKGYQSVVVPYSGGKKLHWFDVSVVQNSEYVNDLFTGFPARFNALPVDCNAIAMR